VRAPFSLLPSPRQLLGLIGEVQDADLKQLTVVAFALSAIIGVGGSIIGGVCVTVYAARPPACTPRGHVQTHTHTPAHTRTHTHTHTCTHTHTHTRTHAQVRLAGQCTG